MRPHIVPKTPQQLLYLKKLQENRKPITVVVGPAGSGKTLFSCQVASELLKDNKISKVIVTRPSVSVDEDLGYLPGGIEEKMSPWSAPILDSFELFMNKTVLKRYIDYKQIDIVPLGFMRGRTFTDTFVIADEMQNSTPNQMKMILTRLGENSKIVVTGDPEQCDLRCPSGLNDIINRLETYKENLDYIERVILENSDIQRHPAVQELAELYDGTEGHE